MCPLRLHVFSSILQIQGLRGCSPKRFSFCVFPLNGDLMLTLIGWKHLLFLFYPSDICEEGDSALREFGGNTVIAKDADSKRQLTEPLKTFIYVPEPAGRERRREGEGGQSAALQKQLLKSSRLTSSLSPGTAVIVSE